MLIMTLMIRNLNHLIIKYLILPLIKDNFLIVIAIIASFAIIGEIYRAYRNGVFAKEG